jgi:hypothetical protein
MEVYQYGGAVNKIIMNVDDLRRNIEYLDGDMEIIISVDGYEMNIDTSSIVREYPQYGSGRVVIYLSKAKK